MSSIELVEKFITRTNPDQAWEHLFGCHPNDTDVAQGVNSYAANALEQAIDTLDEEIDATLFGAPFDLKFQKNKYTINHIRKKLMGSALIAASQKKSSESAIPFETEEEGMGIVGVLGDLTNSINLLEGVGLPDLPKLINTTDCSLNLSPIYLKSGKPAIEIELNDKKMIQGVVGLILNEHLREIIVRKNINYIDIAVTTDSLDLSPYLSFADEEDRYRINEIIKSVQRSVDEGEGDLETLIRFAPFRSTLIQNLTLRILEDFENELNKFGIERISQTKFAASFTSVDDLKPALYRLLGDINYRNLGLIRREVVKHMSIRFPFYAEDGPSFCLVQSDEISMRTFTEISGGADSYIIFPEATAGSEELLEMDDGIILDEDSIHDYKNVKDIIFELFSDTEFLEAE